jgi:hypothetical protein
MRHTHARRISKSLEEDSYIYEYRILEFATKDWEKPEQTSCKVLDSTVNTRTGNVSHTKKESHYFCSRSAFKICKQSPLFCMVFIQWNILQLTTHYLPTRLILLTCVWDGLPDEHCVPQFSRKLRQEPCLHTSSQTYGSNTIPCPRERSQRFLLATQRNTAFSRVH